MIIEIVNLIHVDSVWDRVGHRFQKAIDLCGDDVSTAELWQLCRAGNAFLVIAREGEAIAMASVVRFERWTNGMVLRVVCIAGDRMSEWASEWQAFMVEMAKNNGADRIVSEGREGWQRVFQKSRKLRVVYEMRVD